MKIQWAVPFRFIGGNAAGYTGSSINLRKALQEIGVEITDSAKTVIHYCHPADCFPVHGKTNILMTMYESNPVPSIFAHRFKQVDAVFTPSEFCYNLFKPIIGKKPLLVSKLGFDPTIYTYKNRIWRPGKDTFIWGWNAAPNPRKGYGPAMAAWARIFKDITWAHMIFKTTSETGEGKIITQGNVTFDSRMYSSEELVNFYHGLHGFLYPTGGEGFGLCLDPNTLIQTINGVKTIENISTEDEVLSEDGNFHKILDKVNRYSNTLNIKIHLNKEITCTPEHPFYCIRNKDGKFRSSSAINQSPQWVYASDLRKGDFVGTPIPNLKNDLMTIDLVEFLNDPNILYDDSFVWKKSGYSSNSLHISVAKIMKEFNVSRRIVSDAIWFLRGKTRHTKTTRRKEFSKYKEIAAKIKEANFDIENDPIKINRYIKINNDLLEIFGWYLAEGDPLTGSGLKFSLHKKEINIANKLLNNLRDIFNIKGNAYIVPNSKKSSMYICSTIVSDFFTKILGKGAYNKKLHPLLMNSAIHLGPLVNGLFNGDGNYNSNHIWNLTSASINLIWQIRMILLSVGIMSSPKHSTRDYTYKGKTRKSEIWTLSIAGEYLDKFSKFTNLNYDKKYGKRYKRTLEKNGFIFTPITEINKNKLEQKVIDIEVQDVHSFVGNGILLHNTAIEALATGLPLISTRYGGQMSFLSGDSSWFCDHSFEKVPMTNGDTFINASASHVDLARKMLEIMDEYPMALERARRGADRMHAKWTWQNAARQFVKNVERLGYDD